jgi:hypothetical protein
LYIPHNTIHTEFFFAATQWGSKHRAHHQLLRGHHLPEEQHPINKLFTVIKFRITTINIVISHKYLNKVCLNFIIIIEESQKKTRQKGEF